MTIVTCFTALLVSSLQPWLAPNVLDPAVAPEVRYFGDDADDGSNTWGAVADIELSTGDLGSVLISFSSAANSAERGELYLSINDEIIAHVAASTDPTTSEIVTETWNPSDVAYPPELVLELIERVPIDAIDKVMVGMPPQEFKCSRFGRSVVKVGKYLWTGMVAAGGAACCAGSSGIACALCAAGAAGAALAGQEAADAHCD